MPSSKNPRIPTVAESRAIVGRLLRGGGDFAREQRRADEFNANFQQKQAVHADNLAHQKAQERVAQEHLALARLKTERDRAEAAAKLADEIAKTERSVVALEQMAAFRLNLARLRTDDPDLPYHIMKLRSDYSFAASDPATATRFNAEVETLEKAAKKTQDAYAERASVVGWSNVRRFWNKQTGTMDAAGLSSAVTQQLDRLKNTSLPDDAKLQWTDGNLTITRGAEPSGVPGGASHAPNFGRPGVRNAITQQANNRVAAVMQHAQSGDWSKVPNEYLDDVIALQDAGDDPRALANVRRNIFQREYGLAAQNEGMFQHTEQHARDQQAKQLEDSVRSLQHALTGAIPTEARTSITEQLKQKQEELSKFNSGDNPALNRDATYGGGAPAQPAPANPNLPASSPQQTLLGIQVPKMEAPKPPAPAVQQPSINQ